MIKTTNAGSEVTQGCASLLPEGITARSSVLAKAMLRTLPFEMLDEAVEYFLNELNTGILQKYGYGIFNAAFNMEVRLKVQNRESLGLIRCEPNKEYLNA